MKKKLFFLVLVVGIAAAIALTFLWNKEAEKTSFPIRHVIVEGDCWQVSNKGLERLMAPYAKRGYFLTNLFDLQRKLMKAYPWIASVKISRQWPDTLIVVLHQREAVAVFNHQHLVSPDGTVFTPPLATFPKDLPLLLGPPGEASSLLEKYQLFNDIAKTAHLFLVEIELSSGGSLSVTLNNQTVVMLGDENTVMRFKRFIKVYQQVFVPEHREARSVDMRYDHGMAVTWRS